jgi:hypothetical protein
MDRFVLARKNKYLCDMTIAVSVFTTETYPEDGYSTFLRKTDNCLPGYMV